MNGPKWLIRAGDTVRLRHGGDNDEMLVLRLDLSSEPQKALCRIESEEFRMDIWLLLDTLVRAKQGAPSGFTLIELLVVILIIGAVSSVALPVVVPMVMHRGVDESARIVQAQLHQARDLASRTGMAGLRLLPSKSIPDAYDRFVPLVQPPPYAEGRVNVDLSGYPGGLVPPPGRLVLEEAIGDGRPYTDDKGVYHPEGVRLTPTSWYWNVRVGDVAEIAGSRYTVCGPMAIPTVEGYVNIGDPGTTSPLDRGAGPREWLYLTDRLDDDGDGWVDPGWDGIDNDLDGATDEDDEWEAERWGAVASGGLTAARYTIHRRPIAIATGDVQLAGGTAVDALRSKLPVDRLTGCVDLTFDTSGRVDSPSPYGRPAAYALDSEWLHFWVSGVAGDGSGKVVSVSRRNGRIVSGDADASDVKGTLASQEGR